MGKVIAIVNQKGGVGKTTTSVNLTAAMGDKGKKCLLIDIDPQGNATSGYGISKRDISASSYDLLIGNAEAKDIAVKTNFKNVDVIPSNMNLSGAEVELVELEEREFCLKKAIAPIKDAYDYIILDCPPSLGMITINSLCAADTVLVPIQCEYYALEGLSQLMTTVRQIKRLHNPQLELEGVLLTMYDGRLNLTQQVVAEIKRFFPKKVFANVIPRSVRLSEAPSYGEPILYYDKNSKGSHAYTALAKEIIKNNKRERV
ncbi:MAG: ParA family protein [Clostridia bacterium]|nr:ParA family protein [Clostridia bacterium]